jgi:hypothetical protein
MKHLRHRNWAPKIAACRPTRSTLMTVLLALWLISGTLNDANLELKATLLTPRRIYRPSAPRWTMFRLNFLTRSNLTPHFSLRTLDFIAAQLLLTMGPRPSSAPSQSWRRG